MCATFTYCASEYAAATPMTASGSCRPNGSMQIGTSTRFAMTPYSVLRSGIFVSSLAKNGASMPRWMPDPMMLAA